MQTNKITTYLGFCIRSGKLVFGVDRAETLKKNVFLLFTDSTISNNSFKTLCKLKDKFNCPLLISNEEKIADLVHRPAVKAVALQDKNLASAILSTVAENNNYKLYSGGNN